MDRSMEPIANIPTATTVEAREASRRSLDWKAFFSHLTTLVSVALVVGLGLGFLLLRGPIRQRAEAVVSKEPARIRVEWPELRRSESKSAPVAAGRPVVEAMTWLAPQFQEEILRIATNALGSNPDQLSRAPLDAIGAALEASGWFEGRPNVSREGGSEIVVRGTWRVPAAVVRVEQSGDSKDYLISWDGRPMPVVYPQGRSGLPVILGVMNGPPRSAGGETAFAEVWPGDDVAAGLELLRIVAVQPWKAQVAGVDVTGYAQSRQLVITSVHSTRLVWGGRPSKPLTGECSTNVKLSKISELNSLSNRIDAGHAEIELWWPINKPLEIDRSASAEGKGPAVESAHAEASRR